jgi:hypothetical protein
LLEASLHKIGQHKPSCRTTLIHVKAHKKIIKSVRLLSDKLKNNLILGLMLTLSIAIGTSLYSIIRLRGLESDLSAMYEENVSGENYLQASHIMLLRIEGNIKDLLIGGSGKDLGMSVAGIEQLDMRLTDLVKKATDSYRDRKNSAGLDIFAKDFTEYQRALGAKLQKLGAREKIPNSEMSQLWQAETDFASMIRQLSTASRRKNSLAFESINAQLDFSLLVSVITLVGTFVYRIISFRKRKKTPPCT